jgi:hypothetical protein
LSEVWLLNFLRPEGTLPYQRGITSQSKHTSAGSTAPASISRRRLQVLVVSMEPELTKLRVLGENALGIGNPLVNIQTYMEITIFNN